jgi:hypothetical protein
MFESANGGRKAAVKNLWNVMCPSDDARRFHSYLSNFMVAHVCIRNGHHPIQSLHEKHPAGHINVVRMTYQMD